LDLFAGAFDEFDLKSLINSAIGKEGSHVVVDSGVLVKPLVIQMVRSHIRVCQKRRILNPKILQSNLL